MSVPLIVLVSLTNSLDLRIAAAAGNGDFVGSVGIGNGRKMHFTNTNSGHEIHKEQPQLVIDAIREVVDAVRSQKR